jgi:hypothetical protein
MKSHSELSDLDLRSKIKQKEIGLGGNINLKIFGTLSCASGKKLKRENRVFFLDEKEAIENGFRPCGNCLKPKYQKWKDEII